MSCGGLWSVISHGRERGVEVYYVFLFLFVLRFGIGVELDL